jgi:flagellar protein FliS
MRQGNSATDANVRTIIPTDRKSGEFAMFGTMKSGASAYAKVGVETGVAAASPHKLIVMLLDGAQIAIANALQYMRASDIPAKGKAISKAILIIDGGLRASLDKKVGGEIAANLDGLYEYMSNRLLMANLQNDAGMLDEVRNLLLDIRSAWVAIDAPAAPVAAPITMPGLQLAGTYDSLRPNVSRLVKA